jgi:hypothetical protein
MGLSTALLAAALLLPAALQASGEPTRQDIGRALGLEWFDDSCADPASADGCPVINIYRVVVRNARYKAASRAERAPIRGEFHRAMMCRFEYATAAGDAKPKRWRDIEKMLFLVDGEALCRRGSKPEPCSREWRTGPSQR